MQELRVCDDGNRVIISFVSESPEDKQKVLDFFAGLAGKIDHMPFGQPHSAVPDMPEIPEMTMNPQKETEEHDEIDFSKLPAVLPERLTMKLAIRENLKAKGKTDAYIAKTISSLSDEELYRMYARL